MMQEISEIESRWTTLAGYSGVCRRVGDPFFGCFRCGYVRLPRTHPWYGLRAMDLGANIDVHGGITYAGLQSFGDGHPGWWIGFDCHHADDALEPWEGIESMARHRFPMYTTRGGKGVVRTESYVREQCERLAQQLALAAGTQSYDMPQAAQTGSIRRVR